MWTTIKENDIEHYIREHSVLSEDFDLYKLHQKDDLVVLPRGFIKNYPSKLLSVIKGKFESEKISIPFKNNFKLRPEQSRIVDKVLSVYNKNGFINGIIKARPGAGKSILAIYIAAMFGIKTLIIVDNSNLVKQWTNEILNFTDLKPDDIGLIKQKMMGIDEPICIGMVQSLLAKFKKNSKTLFKSINEAKYGLVVFDEVHKSSASEKYAKISTLFNTNNILGLSASPYKFGAQRILMDNVIGSLLHSENNYELVPEINFILYESGLYKIRAVLMKLSDYIQKKSFYNKHIIKSNKYFDLILKYTKKSLDENHVVIIICWTKKQVESISDILSKNNIVNRPFYGKQTTFEQTDKVLICTYAYAGHGFNFKPLSALIYACPLAGKVSLIQTAGRILRECEGKTQPVIYDLVDLSFPTLFLPDYKKKIKIFKNEFNSKHNEIIEYKKK